MISFCVRSAPINDDASRATRPHSSSHPPIDQPACGCVSVLCAAEAVPSTSPAAAAVPSGEEVAAAAAAAAGATGNAEERADRAVKPKGALKKGTAGSGGGEQKKKAAGGDDQLFQRQARAAAQTAARKAHSQLKVVERCVHRGVHGFRAYTRDTGQRTPPRPAFSGGEHRAGGRVHTPSRVAPPVATPLTYLPWLDSLAQHERRRVGVSAVGSLSLSHAAGTAFDRSV